MTAGASGDVVTDNPAGTPDDARPAGRDGAPSAFREVRPGKVLRIPLVQHPRQTAPEPLASGSSIKQGQPLTNTSTNTDPIPIAPADGTIGQRIEVKLLNGDVVPGVELNPASPSPSTLGEGRGEGLTSATHEALSHPSPERSFAGSGGEGPEFEDLPQFLDRLRAAGFHADRRTCPDLLGQLIDISRNTIDTILCSALDGDPSIPLNSSTAANWPRELCRAVQLLGRLTSAKQQRIIIDDAMPSRLQQPIRAAAREHDLQVSTTINDYPLADPTMLLHRMLRRRLRPRRLPTTQRVLLLDAPVAVAIGRLLLHDEPMTHVPLAIHDRRSGEARVVLVPIGMTLADLLEQLDMPATGVLLRSGELLRDQPAPADAVITAGELVIHLSPCEPDVNPDPCIRCGWCIDACPTRIHPAGLLEAAQQEDLELAERYGIDACIECGICSYVCPSRLPLLHGIHSINNYLELRRGNESV